MADKLSIQPTGELSRSVPPEDRDFFLLLRAGLWQRVGEAISPNPDWPYIYRIACEQTVQGIVADGISLYKAAYDRGDFGDVSFPDSTAPAENQSGTIPAENRASYREIYDDFLDQTAQIVRQNHVINQVQARVCKLLTDSAITYVVLKGQGVAQCYPEPMLRCSGDIDLLLPPESYERAKTLLDPEGKHRASENKVDLHYGIDIDGIEVELHGMANTESGGRLDRALDRERDHLFQTRQFDAISIAGTSCPLPNVNYHAMYLFFHCLRHYMGTGLGIRQICDMAMYLHMHRQQIDWTSLQSVIRETRVEREWQQFLSFCIHYLGMPQTLDARQYLAPRKALSLWLHAKSHGNFGHNHESLIAGHSNRLIHISRLLRYYLITLTRVARTNPRVALSRLVRQLRFLR